MRRLIVAIAVVAVIAGALGAVHALGERAKLYAPLPLDEERLFTVPSGASMRTVAGRLASDGLIENAAALYWYARLTERATAIKAGEFRLLPGMSAVDALDLFVAGDVVLHTVTFVEGWTTRQAVAALQAHPAIAATSGLDDDAALLAALDAVEPHPEGLLFPSTYRFSRGTSDVDVLRQAYRLMREHLDEAWAARAPELPIDNEYDALILASIIEKETARDDEREAIAGVFVRRLEKGMRLQTDPTVIYGLGDSYDGNIRRRDLTTDTPYNTYTRHGLTPTPIALPGAASLRAAVNPADGNALYFVATGDDDGSHYFSATNEEHEAAVARYLDKLRSRRRTP